MALSTDRMAGAPAPIVPPPPVVAVHSIVNQLAQKQSFYHQQAEKSHRGYCQTQCIPVTVFTEQIVTTMSDGSLRHHSPTTRTVQGAAVCTWMAGHGRNHCGVAGHP